MSFTLWISDCSIEKQSPPSINSDVLYCTSDHSTIQYLTPEPGVPSFLYFVLANTNFTPECSLIASLGLSRYLPQQMHPSSPPSPPGPSSDLSSPSPSPALSCSSSEGIAPPSAAPPSPESSPPRPAPDAADCCADGAQQQPLSFASLRTSTGSRTAQSLAPSSPHHIAFTTGSHEVEIFHGEIHLFRDEPVGQMPKNARALPEKRSDLICVLALPARMTVSEIWDWIGGYQTLVGHLRIIRDSSPNKFMVLVRFVDIKSAEMFYSENNLKYFNSMEPEICHLLFIREAVFLRHPPQSQSQSQSQSQPSTEIEDNNNNNNNNNLTHSSSPLSASPLCPSPSRPASASTVVVFRPDAQSRQLVELPNCPVCLERLDTSETGLLTSVCNHTFHCSCLAKWKSDAGCPVCRYCLDKGSETGAASKCSECERTIHLWICLICGHIGCGRYEDGHAFNHFQQTQHTFALELETQRVWDYVGDGYVHRLIQNKADGKLVEFGESTDYPVAPHEGGEVGVPGGMGALEKFTDRKIHDILTEYNFLLTSQLETQRAYYESRLQQLSDHHFALREDARVLAGKLRGAEERLEELQRQLAGKSAKMSKQEADLDFLRQVNTSMQANQEQWQLKIQQVEEAKRRELQGREAHIRDLEEQIKDLSFFIEAQKTITGIDGANELKDGSIVLLPPSPSTKPTRASPSKPNTRRGRGTPKKR